ncbi:MOSC N-terminal beta barrel domain-containing protein [bacterium]|nr:MOSC N-terminal beta barrel domain-containing protein [bacterium]
MPKRRVEALYIYPIKSCGGFKVSEAEVEARGFVNDRRFMVVDADGKFLTQRQHPKLALIKTRIEDGSVYISPPDLPEFAVPLVGFEGETREVVVWKDTVKAVDQGDEVAKLIGEVIEKECRLVRIAEDANRPAKLGRVQIAFTDSYPFMILTSASLKDLNEKLEKKVPMNRFRPSIVVEGAEAYEEDRWDKIKIGEVSMKGMTRCVRCVTINTDQKTGEVDPAPLKTLLSYRKTQDGVVFGRNFNHSGTGTIKVGDEVDVQSTTS